MTLQCATCSFNVITVFSWLLFSMFMLSQPWLANWTNNKWHAHANKHAIYYVDVGTNLTVKKYKDKFGICTIPAADYVCTDGQNFTELALKYRPDHPFGCGCGEGVLGEGLCPRTSYGHTLSDFVSSTPALGLMLGLAIFPLMGAHKVMMDMIVKYKPSARVSHCLHTSFNSFLINFILWSFCSICVFPLSHAILTMTFLGSFVVFCLTVLYLFHQTELSFELEQKVILAGAIISFFAVTLGAIPRVVLIMDVTFGPVFPNYNNGGFGSYSFWLGEAVGLSVFFGLYPLVFLANLIEGDTTWQGTALGTDVNDAGSDYSEENEENEAYYDESKFSARAMCLTSPQS